MLNLCIGAIKLYVDSAKYGMKELKSYQIFISLSHNFVNKPPSLISPPVEGPKLNKPPGGLIELLRYIYIYSFVKEMRTVTD